MIVILLAEGFEEIEAVTTVDFLRRCGIDVKTCAVGEDKTVTGAHGIPVVCDVGQADVVAAGVECLILPGGMPGTRHLEESGWVRELIAGVDAAGGLLAAICAAPSIYGKLGLLGGKSAVCFPGFERSLTGAILTHAPAVQDGRYITSKAAGTAADFAQAIAGALGRPDEAARVRADLYYDER